MARLAVFPRWAYVYGTLMLCCRSVHGQITLGQHEQICVHEARSGCGSLPRGLMCERLVHGLPRCKHRDSTFPFPSANDVGHASGTE